MAPPSVSLQRGYWRAGPARPEEFLKSVEKTTSLHYACSVLSHAVGMVCCLGAATLATSVAGRRDLVASVLGFGVATFWLRPEPLSVGGLVVVVAVLGLGRLRVESLHAAAAGLLAGLWGHVLQGYGLPGWSAMPLAAVVPGVAVVLSRRNPRFAPVALREDALLAITVLGLAVAAAPAFSLGWRSAAAMNLEPGSGVQPTTGVWVPLGLGVVVSLGGLHTLWRRG